MPEPERGTLDDAAIHDLLRELAQAWDRGDAPAYAARFREDGTFTNVNGMLQVGRDDFERRHDEIFRGVFRSTSLSLTAEVIRRPRPDVAIVDVDSGLGRCRVNLPGVRTDADGALHSGLLLVLVHEHGRWWIATYHNVWQLVADFARGG